MKRHSKNTLTDALCPALGAGAGMTLYSLFKHGYSKFDWLEPLFVGVICFVIFIAINAFSNHKKQGKN